VLLPAPELLVPDEDPPGAAPLVDPDLVLLPGVELVLPGVDDVLPLPEDSSRPLISTSWLTCCRSSLAFPSSM
jgi:hypothetical protein